MTEGALILDGVLGAAVDGLEVGGGLEGDVEGGWVEDEGSGGGGGDVDLVVGEVVVDGVVVDGEDEEGDPRRPARTMSIRAATVRDGHAR